MERRLEELFSIEVSVSAGTGIAYGAIDENGIISSIGTCAATAEENQELTDMYVGKASVFEIWNENATCQEELNEYKEIRFINA